MNSRSMRAGGLDTPLSRTREMISSTKMPRTIKLRHNRRDQKSQAMTNRSLSQPFMNRQRIFAVTPWASLVRLKRKDQTKKRRR
jgi:hypothetical protein